MNWISRMNLALKSAIAQFKETYVTAEIFTDAPFESYEARMVRYSIMWSWYENTAYRDIHKWAEGYRSEYGLYKYIRNIYNPSYRLAEFWKTVVWGGLLDPEAGEEGAIPIITEHPLVRTAIKQLWADSNMELNKDVLVGYASSMGDAVIKVCDDVDKQKMRLEFLHPSSIKKVVLDKNHYVKGYIIEEVREFADKECTYTEVANRVAGGVEYKTYKDDVLFPWNGKTHTWVEDYTFVPLVMVQHNSVGKDFGWAEVHPLRSKVMEADDAASKLHDYIRKGVDPIWLFNFAEPRKPITIQGAAKTANNKQPGREETNAIYVPNAAAKGQALISDAIDIDKVGKAISGLLEEMERDFPELQMDIWTAGGYTTGKALKTARQRVERKVIQRRPNYDRALEKAHKMAMSIGSAKGYPGYKDLPVNGYETGDYDHRIPSDRPIFDSDSTTEMQDKQVFWNIVAQAKDKGIPVQLVLRDLGWSKSKIDKFMKEWAEYSPDTVTASTAPDIPTDPNALPQDNVSPDNAGTATTVN